MLTVLDCGRPERSEGCGLGGVGDHARRYLDKRECWGAPIFRPGHVLRI